MPYLTPNQRIALLMHEGTDSSRGKTGLAMLRYSPLEIVAVIDHRCAGKSLSQLTGIQREVPIVASVQAALTLAPTVLAIGIAPSGGGLPEPWYEEVKQAIAAGLSVINGLHTPMAKDPYLTEGMTPEQWIWDVRQEPPGLVIGSARARLLDCRRVLAVGTDMSVGKMSTNLELHQAAVRRGLRSQVIATGQTNLMLGYPGVPLDAVRVDFAAGAIEQQVLKYGADQDIVFIEGQGSLFNPASTATLPLMRGAQPTHLVLVHRPGQTHIQNCPDIRIPPLSSAIQVCETLASAGGAFLAAKVVAIALNTHHLSETEAKQAIQRTTLETQKPCTDVIRFGADSLLDTLINSPVPTHP